MKISLLIPIFNEAHRIEENVNKVMSSVEKISKDYEILLLEDGSTDGSDIIAKRLSENNRHIKFFHSDIRLGKGGAIKKGIEVATGEVIITLDTDLSLNLSFLKTLVNCISEGEDICIASRYVRGSEAKRSLSRGTASRVFNFLVRLFFHTKILDHQSGFKSFNKEKIKKIINEVKNDGFIFDTELLIRAQQKELKIKEVPVYWSEDKKRGSFNFKNDSLTMAKDLFKFWLKERRLKLRSNKVSSQNN